MIKRFRTSPSPPNRAVDSTPMIPTRVGVAEVAPSPVVRHPFQYSRNIDDHGAVVAENSRTTGMSPKMMLRLPMISTIATSTAESAAIWDGPSRRRCTTVRDCWAPVLKRAAPSPTVPRTNAVTRADPPT